MATSSFQPVDYTRTPTISAKILLINFTKEANHRPPKPGRHQSLVCRLYLPGEDATLDQSCTQDYTV